MKQLHLLKRQKSAFGGELMKTRAGRRGARPLAVRETMHLVLRSSKAKGEWSFRKPAHAKAVQEIFLKFSARYGIKIISLANVGNHIHCHLKLGNRFTYKPFIRALTAAIAMAVTGYSRWNRPKEKEKFWDYRPFTRVVQSYRAYLNLNDYVKLNQWEGNGVERVYGKLFIEKLHAVKSEIQNFLVTQAHVHLLKT